MNTRERWNRTSRTYDWLTFGEDLRQGDDKRRQPSQSWFSTQ